MRDLAGSLRTWWYRIKYEFLFKKMTLGEGTRIRSRLLIKGPGKVVVGANCILDKDPWGADFVTFHTHHPEALIAIGDNVILRATRFGCHENITVGTGAVLENASLYDSDFHNVDASRRDEDYHHRNRPVIIGDHCYLGLECQCGKGAQLGPSVKVLPLSIIGTRRVPGSATIWGNPPKLARPLS